MPEQLLIALAQLNPTVGDISGNAAKLMAAWREAQRRGADLLVTSEMFLVGYSPDDFVLKPRMQKIIRESIDALARDTVSGPAILLGTLWVEDGKCYNAALLLEGGKIVDRTFKHALPNYGPFDELRLFEPGPMPKPLSWRDTRLGVILCEDMWRPTVALELKKQGAELLVVLNASPYQVGKQHRRYDLAHDRIRETGLSLIYVNQVGGQDELLYEGASFAMSPSCELKVQAHAWSEDLPFITFKNVDQKLTPDSLPLAVIQEAEASIYQAIMTGIRDYVTKNGFSRVLLGLSGGIDSALVAALAVDALGAANVWCVSMPSPFTSKDSIEDAEDTAKRLGCRLDTIPINAAMDAFETMLLDQFMGTQPDVAEENIQARCRGIVLMALSNKSGGMVLSTGNKSEIAVGYSTLYGDTCGGYAPLKDVYKTEVYKLARWRNANKPILALGPEAQLIPERVLTKAPSAELRANQTDQDTLLPYPLLDDILKCLIEQDLGIAETTMMGHDPTNIRQVYMMLDRAEYKRRQSPPGPKVSRRHLTKDRRYPITNRYSEKWKTQQSD